MRSRLWLALVAGSVVFAACGTDSGSDEPAPSTINEPSTTSTALSTTLGPPNEEPVGDLTPGPRGNTTITALPELASPSGMYRLVTFVIQDPSAPPVACMGGVAESLPPQCGGIALIGFNWDNVSADEAGGVRFTTADVYLEGSFEGDAFRLTLNRDARADDRPPRVSADLEAACPEPEGGWANVDPTLVDAANLDSALEYAQTIDDASAVWISQPAMSGPSPLEQIINVRVVTDRDFHEGELWLRWGGPLCVVEGGVKLSDLRQIQQEIADATELGAVAIGVDQITGTVDTTVIIAGAAIVAEVESRWPGDLVRLSPIFRPLP